jgi:hypothetical protein
MAYRLGSKKVAVGALIALGAVGGSVAYAYPPGTSMNISATATPTGYGGANVVVTVHNANPECQINIKVQGANEVVVPAERGGTPEAEVITRTVVTTASRGQRKVTVKATNCTAREKSQTVFDIIDARLETNSTVYEQGDQFTVRAFGFTPHARIVFRFTPASGAPGLEQSATDLTDRKGNARARFRIKGNAPTGNWVLSAFTGSVHNETTLEVEHPSR